MIMEDIVKTIEASTATAVWLAAMDYLFTQKDEERYNLTLAIAEPTVITPTEKNVLDVIDVALLKAKLSPLATVAGTIFPANHYLRSGSDGVYEDFPNDFAFADTPPWGTYAMRMLRMVGREGTTINPLEELVNKIKKRPSNERLFYEMNVSELNDFDLPIYRTALDYKRRMPQPCLSHLSFKLFPENKLGLAVMYRSHYYTERALGNLLGLGQLQYFVATETGLGVGPLVCHSTHARVDTHTGMGLTEIKALVSKCRAMPKED